MDTEVSMADVAHKAVCHQRIRALVNDQPFSRRRDEVVAELNAEASALASRGKLPNGR